MLTLDQIRITQGSFTLDADFTLEAGTRTAIIGPSGAGKSTLISAIGGFLPLTSGRIVIDGKDVTDLPAGARPVTTVFQDANLFPHLTVAQNAGLGLNPSLKLTANDHDQIAQAIARVGLDGLADRKPAQLSGGQQSRAALARMLLRAAPIALLDEPFSALGPALKTDMLDLLAEIATERNLTLLMVTHSPEDAQRIAPHSILVADGKAHAPQPTKALFDNPPEALRAYLGT
jgi:thiamine transport system ATP-binding protein